VSFVILGLGTAVPDTSLSQTEGLALIQKLCCNTPQQQDWLSAIYQRSEINNRHIVLDRQVVADVLSGDNRSGSPFVPSDGSGPSTAERMREYAKCAGPLAATAAQLALKQAQLQPHDITHLVTVSCTGARAPGVDISLIKELGLPPTTQRTHIGFMGCHGALNGLRVAKAFTGADPSSRVLICAVELCSLHYYYGWDPQKMIVNSIFSDGAAAVVGTSARRRSTSEKSPVSWQLSGSGSCVFPNSTDAMSWSIGDAGFEMTLARNVPGLIAQCLPSWLNDWLHQHELRIDQVGSWAVHPGGPKVLTAVQESLNLPAAAIEPARQVLAEYGNMSSPTILFLLQRLRQMEAPRPCVALAFGPGLTVEAALFR